MKFEKKELIEYLSRPEVKLLDCEIQNELKTVIDSGWLNSEPTGMATINIKIFTPQKKGKKK